MPENQLLKHMQLTKVDVAKKLIYGIFTAEQPDKSGEVADYETTKAAFQTWSDDMLKVSQGKSKGNIRKMHGKEVVGKAVEINFDDANKIISGCVEVNQQTVDEAEKGYLNGFSIGGIYAKKWPCPVFKGKTRFTPVMGELSLVDNPCVPDALFSAIKDASFQVLTAAGATEMRKFIPKEIETVQMFKAADGSLHDSKESVISKNAQLSADAAAAPALAALDALGKKEETPDPAALKKQEDMKKAMHHVAQLANVIGNLSDLAKSHEAQKGEGHPVTEKLKKHVRGLSDTMHAMAGDEAGNMNDAHEACKAAGLAETDAEAITKAVAIGAALPAADTGKEAALQEQLIKATAEKTALEKALADMPAKIEAKFAAMQKRIADLEAQPAADKTVTTVFKGGETDPNQQEEKKPVPVNTAGISPAGFRKIMNK